MDFFDFAELQYFLNSINNDSFQRKILHEKVSFLEATYIQTIRAFLPRGAEKSRSGVVKISYLSNNAFRYFMQHSYINARETMR